MVNHEKNFKKTQKNKKYFQSQPVREPLYYSEKLPHVTTTVHNRQI